MKIGFIGLGNMAGAIIGGVIASGIAKPEDILGSAHTKASVDRIVEKYGIIGCKDNTEVAEKSDIIFYAVKPQMYEEVIRETSAVVKNQIIVSIAPGKTLAWLSSLFAEGTAVIRCMPNTPAMVGEGCTGVCRNEAVSDEAFDEVMKILGSFGKAYEVKESMMDAVVAVSGSSPAYVFMMIEAMADGAVMAGMPRAQAYNFAAQAMLGSAKMVLEMGMHPGALKDMVTSPAGTTIEGVRVLEERGFRAAVIDAEKAVAEKSAGM